MLDVVLGQGRSPGRLLLDGLPRPTLAGFTVFAVWYVSQAALAIALPGRIGHGAITPAGHRPAYRLNGLLAWLVTHVLLGLAVFRWRLFPSTIVADNSGGLLYAVYLTVLLIHRVHRDDRRCREKYGAAWAAYCEAVPYRMVPRVW
jgi:protein-S-isoprenylcysteine O-methyltransferase Ste14